MSYTGIDRVTYGVANLDKARQYFTDWGVAKVSSSKSGALFRTAIGAEIMLRPLGDKSLPKAVHRGSTVREVTWGVSSKADLKRIAAELAKDRDVTEDKDGTIHSVDPIGLGIAFRKSTLKPFKATRAPINSPGKIERVDVRATFYDQAVPQSIGHTVWFAKEPEKIERFYAERLGFFVTDRFEGGGSFLRCQENGGHHNHVLFKSPDGKEKLDHVAFLVRDINEVFAGGLAFSKKGYKTAVGPGRHWMSSAYFWYFKCPAGGMTEYFTDEDHATRNWKTMSIPRSINSFAEWFVPDGLKVL